MLAHQSCLASFVSAKPPRPNHEASLKFAVATQVHSFYRAVYCCVQPAVPKRRENMEPLLLLASCSGQLLCAAMNNCPASWKVRSKIEKTCLGELSELIMLLCPLCYWVITYFLYEAMEYSCNTSNAAKHTSRPLPHEEQFV